jgi:putative hydrolases of HD superfamily
MHNEKKTKASNPLSTLKSSNISPFIHVYFELNHLKQLYRQGWLLRGIPAEHCESVAEHTFGVAVLAMVLADSFFPELNTLTVVRMALIHDFGEVYAGDIIPGNNISPAEKHKLEQESIIKIFKNLPNGNDYITLWEEFECRSSPEAQFVRQIDKLEMALQASVYEHQKYENLAEFFKSAGSEISSPELHSILKELENLA